ncbi:hypothetical protein D6764_03425 [Candidatus Woesearchaeota archaeon]|nr:MAG: hypothetical protein D6764_03425 [Candidatus Woesearchaeota archaeon]
MILEFLITMLIVGFVTGGLNIKFDRFFTILLLLFIFRMNIFDSVNVFLWVIMLGALMILLNNKDKIAKVPHSKKVKLFILIPIFTFIASFFGSTAFRIAPAWLLIATLGVLAILYGLRLMFIHFEEHELKFEKGHPRITKMCGLLGPWISGFSVGFIGTSLKPLKIPFAIKVGRMNAKEVYLGNTVTTFFASAFSIMWHYFLKDISPAAFYSQMLLGAALWTGIHYTFEITNLFFKEKWRKPFQVMIGIFLLMASVKVFMLL